MTGLQALERIAPDKGLAPGQVVRQEFEYVRHGTTTLMGNLEVTTGTLLAPTLGPTRTEADFVRHLAGVVATDPEAPWVFVVDNLNVHCSAGLVEWIASVCGVHCDLGVKEKRGILKSQASRRAFLSASDHRIRLVYTPKHSSWLNQIEIAFGIIHRKVIRRGSFSSVNDLETELRQFIDYYNQTMAHPFAWTFTGKPLATHGPIRFCPRHRHPEPRNVKLGNFALP